MSEKNQNTIPPMVFQEALRIRPLGDHVLLEADDHDRKTASGLILPSADRTKPLTGRVLAVGAGRRAANGQLVKPPVKKGDRVIFHRYEGTEIQHGGSPAVLILEPGDILAIILPGAKK